MRIPFGKHPSKEEKRMREAFLPGRVHEATKREATMRLSLQKGTVPASEDFDRVVQVFAHRARQEMKWASVQRREFIRRAKRWATEMLLQELEPSPTTVQALMLGFAVTGDRGGAKWWLSWLQRTPGREAGRLAYNCVIEAFGMDGRPKEAEAWLNQMREAGIVPDARSHAGVVQAWERIGNRQAMLEKLLQVRDLEADGELGEPLNPTDAGLPYYVLGPSLLLNKGLFFDIFGFATICTPRTWLARDRQICEEGSSECGGAPTPFRISPSGATPNSNGVVHLIHFAQSSSFAGKVPPGPRRSVPEIERAFVDVVKNRPKSGPVMMPELAEKCGWALGQQRFQEILAQHGAGFADVVATELPSQNRVHGYRIAKVQTSIASGQGPKLSLNLKEDDGEYIKQRLRDRRGAKVGVVKAGIRIPGQKGLPEWMTLPKPVRFAT
ncbi:unnamed protein product [Polarella glacialis]|uniref:Pentatricopeptide repeat-containing protein n=1 Tax=Polarella glacialis TaxID=89957 RepID=A0A813LGW5_POLGL|nr:unnamed protein product [Polarella glacialis]